MGLCTLLKALNLFYTPNRKTDVKMTESKVRDPHVPDPRVIYGNVGAAHIVTLSGLRRRRSHLGSQVFVHSGGSANQLPHCLARGDSLIQSKPHPQGRMGPKSSDLLSCPFAVLPSGLWT